MTTELSAYTVLREEYERLHPEAPLPPDVHDLETLIPHLHARNRTALCLSGGGIRSATFALGLIQGLASLGQKVSHGVLTQFDYLSTVSGGGYIGGWLSAYARRSGGIANVARELAPPDDPDAPSRPKLRPEATPLRHLRDYSNYLAPKLGLLSADTWTVAGTYLRNVVLTWLVLIPLFVAILAIPRLLVAVLHLDGHGWPTIGALVVAGIGFLWGLIYLSSARPVSRDLRFGFHRVDRGQDKSALTNGEFLRHAIVPLTLCAAAFVAAYGWNRHSERTSVSPLWVAGIAAVAGGVLSVYYVVRYMKALGEDERDAGHRQRLRAKQRRKLVVELLSALFAGASFAATAYGLLWNFDTPFGHMSAPSPADWLGLDAISGRTAIVDYVCFAVPLIIGALLVQATIFIALSSGQNDDNDREWWARSGAWTLLVAAGWIAVTVLSLYGPVLIYYAPRTISGVGMITGGFAVLMGRSAKTAANAKQKEEEGLLGKSLNISLGAAVPIFVLCLFAGLSLLTTQAFAGWLRARSDMAKPLRGDERALLERSSWKLEGEQDALPATGFSKRKTESSDFPRFEGDKYDARLHLWVVDHTEWWQALTLIAGLAILGVIASFFVGSNQFSMHALYRSRLIRAYLGASNLDRIPNPFTGFDPFDNIRMANLATDVVLVEDIDPVAAKRLMRDTDPLKNEAPLKVKRALAAQFTGELRGAKTPAQRLAMRKRIEQQWPGAVRPVSPRPLHIVNAALNLVSGEDLARQERKADSFTISPLHCGSYDLGYRRSGEYGGAAGISLGTAVAISGAAASPNMGYHSSPALAALLTFFNVRLGMWLGNPGPAGEDAYRDANPDSSLRALFAEALGLTNKDYKYVYLSDGGHFENLGLYEMVLRRCRYIVVSDAAEDEKFVFDDLGNAIRKIRIDFGIRVTVEEMGLYPRDEKDPANPKYCAWGYVHYDDMDKGATPGTFLYIKPVFYGKAEPKDIYNYAKTNPTFPHESTGDQFFTESQFESYRALGEYAIREICRGAKKEPATVEELIGVAKQYVTSPKKSAIKSFFGKLSGS